MKSIFKTIQAHVKSRQRLVMATVVAAIFGLFVGIAGFRLLPGLRARVGIPDWPNSASPPSNGNDPGLGQNRLRDRQARKMAWNNGLESSAQARQLAQAVMATVRNFYLDSERVSENKLGEILVKVLRRKSSAIAVSLSSNSIILGSQKKSVAFPLTTAGLVDAITEGSVLLSAEDRNEVSDNSDETDRGPVKKCREILNLMVSELDPHSSVLSPASYNELRQGTEGSFGGLGVLVGLRNRVLTVIKPLPNSPAAQAGVLGGDRIVRINNQPTFGMALEDLMDFMRGSPGTHVTMRILREGSHSPMDLVIKREVIQVDSVTSHPVEFGELRILRISVETFSAKTSREILSAMKAFKKNRGAIDGLILDLRSNPGGLLDQAVQVTDLFLEEGVIVSTRGRREEIEVAGKGYDEVEFPMVVLIDEESASASEIVAGALQDHGRAVILGQPSFGKGSVQTVFELPFDIALKLTIARYFTPLNRSIQNVGILPDLWLQPLIEKNENLNLFGPSRYRNEGFLVHRLDEKSDGRQRIMDLDQQMSESCCSKSYFIASKSGAEDADDEIDAAKRVIFAAHDAMLSGRNHVSWGVDKAREWIRDRAVHASVTKMAAEASLWIKSRFGIEWAQPNERGHFKSLATQGGTVDFKVQSLSGKQAIAGDESRFLWTITNMGARPMRRISVYLRSSGVTGETQEILVGSVEPGESKSGPISCRVPFVSLEDSWDIDVGLAMDAWPVMSLVKQFQLKVETRDRPILSFVTSIVSERGGVANGVLDAGERANLHVVITNQGRVGVNEMSVNLVNLSGGRVSVAEGEIIKKPITAGSSESFDIPLVFHGNHSSEEVDVGISIESKEMESPVVRQITLPVSAIAGRVGQTVHEFPK
jgi:carboxyl-terminal processing protease